MSLDPLSGFRFRPAPGTPGLVPGGLVSAEVVESLGNRRYRVVIEGRLLEAVSSVSLLLGEEVLARVRHAGPPVLLELMADRASPSADPSPARPGAYALLRDGTAAAAPPGGRPAGIAQALSDLVAALSEEKRAALAPLLQRRPFPSPAELRPIVESLAQSLLASDAELRRLDGWISSLDQALAGRPVPSPDRIAAALSEALAALSPQERALLEQGLPAGSADPAAERLREVLARIPPDLLASHPGLARLADSARAAGPDEASPAPTPPEASVLAGSPDAPESRAWIERLAPLRIERIRAFLAAREEQAIGGRPWSAPLREVARLLDAPGSLATPDAVPFWSPEGRGMLRVYAREEKAEKGRRGRLGPPRVGIFLEMSRLGPVGALVSGDAGTGRLSVDFSVERADARSRLRAALPELESALKGIGWREAGLRVTEAERPAAQALFEGESPQGSIDVVA